MIELLRVELETRQEIVLAVLHGSFLLGGTYRDIDVAVWLGPGLPSPGERFRYALDLSVGLHLRLGLPVDVRVLNDAPLAFRYHALHCLRRVSASGTPSICRWVCRWVFTSGWGSRSTSAC